MSPPPEWLEVINGLFKFVGAPAAIALGIMWFARRWIIPKANGEQREAQQAAADAHYEALRDHITASFKDLLHRYDMAQTLGFTQLQKDLTTTIQKETENAMTKALFNMWQARDRK